MIRLDWHWNAWLAGVSWWAEWDALEPDGNRVTAPERWAVVAYLCGSGQGFRPVRRVRGVRLTALCVSATLEWAGRGVPACECCDD